MKTILIPFILISSISFSNDAGIDDPIIIPPPPVDPVPDLFDFDCDQYSISVGDGWEPYETNTNPLTFVKTTKTLQYGDEVQYRTDVQHILLRYMNVNLYSYLCRVCVTPVAPTNRRDENGVYYGSTWSFQELNVSMDLPNGYYIGDWSPRNSPAVVNNTYGISVGVNGASISASVDYTQSLNIISHTNIVTNHFETIYKYMLFDQYSTNSITYLTMLKFSTLQTLDPSYFPLVHFKTVYYNSANPTNTTDTMEFVSRPVITNTVIINPLE